MSRIAPIWLPEADRERLDKLIRDRNTPQKVVWRSRIVVLSAQGMRPPAVATAVGKSELTVRRWRRRYLEKGVAGLLKDATRPPGRKPIPVAVIKQVVELTLHEVPPGRTRWSERTMAVRVGIAPSSVHAIWKAHGLKPHLTRIFKLSRDPAFTEKVEDIVGLYLNPPDKALVLSVDEKSQIQALDRTQPGLPMKPGKCGTMTHDYKRNGTTTLFAALNILDGTVVGRCMPSHTHKEFITFLNAVERAVRPGRIIHAIADNYATHKHPKVKQWLADHPRWVFHFTPTSASWLNAVEGFFSTITRRRIRRGVFKSVADLEDAIHRYIREHNQSSKPFIWTKPADTILAKLHRLPVPSE
jgi:transposase